MDEHTYIWIYIYLVGFSISGVVFYNGAIRGKAKRPELWSVIFSMFWFVSIPLLVWQVFKAFRDDKK